jgi:hypothetical protein
VAVFGCALKVEPEFGDYKEFFPKCMDKLASMSVNEAREYAKEDS